MQLPVLPARKPYTGAFRKLVVAFDVGTTYSGVSFAILDPGLVPVIQGVTRYAAQQKVGGDSKIPTIIYYDAQGDVKAVGAEAIDEAFLEKAEDEGYTKVEWFKLHLRPKALAASHITDADIPALPQGKTVLDIFADVLRYLFAAVKLYITETMPSGASLLSSVEHNIDFVLTHPNGWEGQQQGLMRRAAVVAGLIKDGIGQDRLQFVTEGEASLHFCINKNVLTKDQINGKGIIIVDAGGGTVDLSAYANKTNTDNAFEEIAPTECRLQGSVLVGRRARAHIEAKLRNTKFGAVEDVNHMASVFDKSTKLSFRTSNEPAYIRFGSARDKDLTVDIRNGQLKLDGETVSGFFEPSIQAILEAIKTQRESSSVEISTVLLVGGFAASDWLFGRLRDVLAQSLISVCRPDGHVNKAVADGAISFYLDHFVTTRVANLTYGVEIDVECDADDLEHRARYHTSYYDATGLRYVPGAFSSILKKGTRINEETEFRSSYVQTSANATGLNGISAEILSYRGAYPHPIWLDIAPQPDSFVTLCTVTADTMAVPKRRQPPRSAHGSHWYGLSFDIVLLFGLTELKAQIAWTENGIEKRSPASIVYDSVLQSRQ
ncbi:hypothetical protein CPB85DRAFT_1254346 [Mucidula mucida]|nr:hypothetical protein CPB85DRAFT_1254346 [Mucidula mucida]